VNFPAFRSGLYENTVRFFLVLCGILCYNGHKSPSGYAIHEIVLLPELYTQDMHCFDLRAVQISIDGGVLFCVKNGCPTPVQTLPV